MSTEKKEVKVVKTVESEWMKIEGCKIISVTSKEAIADLAIANKIDPTEVFVRITFNYKDAEYKASQKLRILGKENYQKLIDLKESGELIDLDVSNTEFFRIHREVSLDDLFKNAGSAKQDLRNSVNKLFA
jgi:hypothetical protein